MRRYFLGFCCAAVFSACSPQASKPTFHSVDVTGIPYAQGFNLQDQNGKRRSLQDFRGKVVVLFFGFTQCPQVCPTTLSELMEVKKTLGAQADKLQVVFVTLDPSRDTPEVLKAYMSHFDTSFLALRPTEAELPAVAQAFKIYYKQIPGATATSYSLDHTASSYIFDPQGHVRLYTRYGSPPAAVAEDVRQLL